MTLEEPWMVKKKVSIVVNKHQEPTSKATSCLLQQKNNLYKIQSIRTTNTWPELRPIILSVPVNLKPFYTTLIKTALHLAKEKRMDYASP